MRITNINTLSALFDRLITENIKKFFFMKDAEYEKTTHQGEVIQMIKDKISACLEEILAGEYESIAELRTFDEKAIIEELEELTFNDINIGEADRARLAEVQSDDPDLKVMIQGEKLLRKSNEGRASNKNRIDKLCNN